MKKFGIVFMLLLISAGGTITADDRKQTASVNTRLEFVERLIERSSGARKVDSSNLKAARQRRQDARMYYRQSIAAHEQGDDRKAHEFLDKATNTMFEAVRLTGKQDVVKDIELHRYQSRLDSLNAMCDAYDRIRVEKNLGPANETELYSFVEQRRTQAESLKAVDKLAEARQALDEAYVGAKVAIEQIRGGDTLVRSLKFATNEEEYLYEIDRNDTHKMLVQVLTEQKVSSDPNKSKMIDGFVKNAEKIRGQAERKAETGDYNEAIKLLENSTKEFVRAIRSVGIFIPG